MIGVKQLMQCIHELGFVPVIQNGCYQTLLKSGIFRSLMPHRPLRNETNHGDFDPLPLPEEERLKPFLTADSVRILMIRK